MVAEQAKRYLAGRRYISYGRTATQDVARVEEQIRLIRQFGACFNMVCVDEVRLPGVGGGLPALRPDLRDLLARKLADDDFDMLVMEDRARLTRTLPEDFRKVELAFSRAGIRILYVRELVPPAWPGK